SKQRPTISTSATSSVVIGGAISDTATLGNTTSDAGGTITFRLFSDAACSTEVATGLSPVAVTGSGNYGSGSFTPGAVGTNRWIVTYSGDANHNGATSLCGTENFTLSISNG